MESRSENNQQEIPYKGHCGHLEVLLNLFPCSNRAFTLRKFGYLNSLTALLEYFNFFKESINALYFQRAFKVKKIMSIHLY